MSEENVTKKEKKVKNKEQRRYNNSQVIVKIVAGILAVIMLLAVGATLVFSLR